MTRKHEKQTRYLSQAAQLEEAINPRVIRATMGMVSLTILAFIVWSAMTNINEIARTTGEIVPQGFQQTVQHLEGGIVKEILVSEGELVEKNQMLIHLNGAGIEEDLERARATAKTLALQEERLRAFLDGRQPDWTSATTSDAMTIQDQKVFYNAMMRARQEEREVIKDQIEQKQRMIASMASDLSTVRQNGKIIQRLYDRRADLNKQGYVSDVRYLETRQQLNDIQGEIRRLENRVEVTKSEIAELDSRLNSLDARYRDEAAEKLDNVVGQKLQNHELIEKLAKRVARLEVKAPVAGRVKGLSINTVGAVVAPGQVLMEIVPQDENLMVQIKIPPQHIGHLKTGQDVQVKFSSFDFSRYGSVHGVLDKISATTFNGQNGERFYRGQVALDKTYVGQDPRNIIIPGMTVMADIITGEKTILDYLLKPIRVSMKTAFTER